MSMESRPKFSPLFIISPTNWKDILQNTTKIEGKRPFRSYVLAFTIPIFFFMVYFTTVAVIFCIKIVLSEKAERDENMSQNLQISTLLGTVIYAGLVAASDHYYVQKRDKLKNST